MALTFRQHRFDALRLLAGEVNSFIRRGVTFERYQQNGAYHLARPGYHADRRSAIGYPKIANLVASDEREPSALLSYVRFLYRAQSGRARCFIQTLSQD